MRTALMHKTGAFAGTFPTTFLRSRGQSLRITIAITEHGRFPHAKRAALCAVLTRCRRCGEQFDPDDDGGADACRFHASVIGARGFYTRAVVRRTRRVIGEGRPRINLRGEIVEGPLGKEDIVVRQEFVSRWNCCHSEKVEDKGCKTGRHLTYDDEDERFEDDWPKRNNGLLGFGNRRVL